MQVRYSLIPLAAVAAVLRLWNLVYPNPELGPASLMTATGLLGGLFLVTGLHVWRRAAAHASLFALHCVCQAIHWGGPPTLDDTPIEIWLAYLLISVLGQSALVAFALGYLSGRPTTRWNTTWVWAPTALLASVALAIVALGDAPRADVLLAAFLTIEPLAANVLALAAIGILAWRWQHPPTVPGAGDAFRTMLLASVVAVAPWLAGSLAGVDIAAAGAQPLTLLFGIMPIGFACAIRQQLRRET